MNAPKNLALEATFINQNFSQQVLKSVRYNLFKSYNYYNASKDNPSYLVVLAQFI